MLVVELSLLFRIFFMQILISQFARAPIDAFFRGFNARKMKRKKKKFKEWGNCKRVRETETKRNNWKITLTWMSFNNSAFRRRMSKRSCCSSGVRSAKRKKKTHKIKTHQYIQHRWAPNPNLGDLGTQGTNMHIRHPHFIASRAPTLDLRL
jgi:hypothetical protein